MILDAEFVICPRNPNRARKLLTGLAKHNGQTPIDKPTFTKEWLFMWGPGGQWQRNFAARQQQKGGQVVFFDIGYFGRSSNSITGGVRMSFNGAHPEKYFDVAPLENSRFVNHGIAVEELYNPDGPVVLCGLGRKSRALYGYSGMEWEKRMVGEIRERFPSREIIYRPKPKHNETLAGTRSGINGEIRQYLNKASLVVCHHSNTSVDSAIYGIPCVCFSGVGVRLWGVGNWDVTPKDKQERFDFLSRVAWFNWFLRECPEILEYVKEHGPKIRQFSQT